MVAAQKHRRQLKRCQTGTVVPRHSGNHVLQTRENKQVLKDALADGKATHLPALGRDDAARLVEHDEIDQAGGNQALLRAEDGVAHVAPSCRIRKMSEAKPPKSSGT